MPTAHQARPTGRHPATVALLMLLPAAVLMITFLIIPIGLTFALAFTNARLDFARAGTVHRVR